MHKIIIKVGTSSLTQGTERLSRRHMLELVQQIVDLHHRGLQLILVTSGAIATGKELLCSHKMNQSPSKQTFASIGQVRLMQVWTELFSLFDLQVGQVLVTKNDFSSSNQDVTRDTLSSLLQNHIIPIINENDTLLLKESCIGNNDHLAALVAELTLADTVILLTDQEGLYTADPRLDPDAKLIPIVKQVNEKICALGGNSSTDLGTGGMKTKIEAAKIASVRGIQTIIASSFRPNVLIDLVEGRAIGTLFLEEKEGDIKQLAIASKRASLEMAQATPEQKNKALEILIENLKKQKELIVEANQQDLSRAKANGLSPPLLERMCLENRIDGMIQEIQQVIALSDPIGEFFDEKTLLNKLKVAKCRTPIGVLGVIYESRPNVTIDISVLTIKSGNSVLLRGGVETLQTNQILVKVIQNSLQAAGLPSAAIQLIVNPDRSKIKELLELHEYIDVIIPRGGPALQEFCRKHSTIPVITGGVGICHLFVDETADVDLSLLVILNAKTQRPTVCNALDTLLVHRAIAPFFIPKVVEALRKEGVIFHLDPKAWKLVQEKSCTLADEQDWNTEWLSLVLGIKVVENVEEATIHIQHHSKGHSDGILTECQKSANFFIKEVDSAAVYVNASTRFTDGGEFGLGAEVAVSTQKLHARGPMGLLELTSYKWIVRGNYQIRT